MSQGLQILQTKNTLFEIHANKAASNKNIILKKCDFFKQLFVKQLLNSLKKNAFFYIVKRGA